MTELEGKLNYTFKNSGLLETAITHSSYANENMKQNISCNERLEFLGDSVLGLTVAKDLYKAFPDMPEGQMTKLRADLVCEHSLAEAAKKLDLGAYMRFGKGEKNCGGRTRPSILADAMEAVIAAVYLDGGFEAAEQLIYKLILDPMKHGQKAVNRDYKTTLQEIVQRQSGQILTYELVGESGPDHNKVFTAVVKLNGKLQGIGTGRNKKEAEQAAARYVLEEQNG